MHGLGLRVTVCVYVLDTFIMNGFLFVVVCCRQLDLKSPVVLPPS